MKKVSLLFLLCMLTFTLVGCGGYDETREYPIESTRYYVETIEQKESKFVTTTNKHEYIEFIYVNNNGEYVKDSEPLYNVKIADESKAVEEKGHLGPFLYLTI